MLLHPKYSKIQCVLFAIADSAQERGEVRYHSPSCPCVKGQSEDAMPGGSSLDMQDKRGRYTFPYFLCRVLALWLGAGCHLLSFQGLCGIPTPEEGSLGMYRTVWL